MYRKLTLFSRGAPPSQEDIEREYPHDSGKAWMQVAFAVLFFLSVGILLGCILPPILHITNHTVWYDAVAVPTYILLGGALLLYTGYVGVEEKEADDYRRIFRVQNQRLSSQEITK